MLPQRLSRVPAAAPHELVRQRLLAQLRARATCPLILILAPAGFGKSTLAAAYARESGAAVAWVSLTAADRDSRVFFSGLHDSIANAMGDRLVLPALLRGLEEGAEGAGLARLLGLDLAAVSERFLLVLDDFHSVDGAKDVIQAVDSLLRTLPRGGQVVLTARSCRVSRSTDWSPQSQSSRSARMTCVSRRRRPPTCADCAAVTRAMMRWPEAGLPAFCSVAPRVSSA